MGGLGVKKFENPRVLFIFNVDLFTTVVYDSLISLLISEWFVNAVLLGRILICASYKYLTLAINIQIMRSCTFNARLKFSIPHRENYRSNICLRFTINRLSLS